MVERVGSSHHIQGTFDVILTSVKNTYFLLGYHILQNCRISIAKHKFWFILAPVVCQSCLQKPCNLFSVYFFPFELNSSSAYSLVQLQSQIAIKRINTLTSKYLMIRSSLAVRFWHSLRDGCPYQISCFHYCIALLSRRQSKNRNIFSDLWSLSVLFNKPLHHNRYVVLIHLTFTR